jgi:hypothetical protein
MRLSELIIIYLAAAAPTGVAYFMQRHKPARRALRLLRATAVALLWPIALGLRLRRPRSHSQLTKGSDATQGPEPAEARINAAERAIIGTLHQTDDLLRETYGARATRARTAATESRAAIERFVKLALALAAQAQTTTPSPRELELYRVAGRTGDDLLIAGRCIHRRNLARLRAHHAQAGTDFVHALAALLETIEHDLPMERAGAPAFAQLYWLVIRTFAQAFDLLSLLDEQPTAMSVARLLDAACAWARRHEVIELPHMSAQEIGGILCPPQTTPSSLTRPTPQPTI